VLNALKQSFYTSDFGVRSADIVGPQVGGQLKKQATLALDFHCWPCWCICGSALS